MRRVAVIENKISVKNFHCDYLKNTWTRPYRNSVYFKYTSSILCMYFQEKKYN